MVTVKKSLFYAIFLIALSFCIYSQEKELPVEENVSTEVVTQQADSNNDVFESNSSYFSTKQNENDGNVNKSSNVFWTIIKFIFFLAIVIAAIYFVMKFFQRKGSFSKSDDDFLRRVSTMNLSPGKSVEIVTLLDKGYILGVTDNSINLISEINDKELLEALNLNFDKKQNTKKPMNFSDVLDMFMAKNPKKNDIYGDIQNNLKNVKRNPFKKDNDSE